MKEVRSSWENVDRQRGFRVEHTGSIPSEEKPEMAVDGGGWQRTCLSPTHMSHTWRQVSYRASEA